MTNRRNFLLALSIASLSAPLLSRAQSTTRVPRVGFLTAASPKPQIPRPIEEFRRAIRELGYIEGETILIEFRWAEGKVERLPELAADLVRAKVDVIVAAADAAIRAAMGATSTIPIVMANSGDAVGAGFVAHLARPGGNVTGMTSIGPELSAKRLQILKDLLPENSRVAVIWSPNDPVHVLDWKHTQAAERIVRVTLQSVEVRSAENFDNALAEIRRTPAKALIVFHNTLIFSLRERIVNFAAKSRLPAMYEAAEWADEGGLMAYGVTHAILYRQSAGHVNKILKGAKPAELPVEQPTTYQLVINMKTAKSLGLTIPQSVLLRADRVIE